MKKVDITHLVGEYENVFTPDNGILILMNHSYYLPLCYGILSRVGYSWIVEMPIRDEVWDKIKDMKTDIGYLYLRHEVIDGMEVWKDIKLLEVSFLTND